MKKFYNNLPEASLLICKILSIVSLCLVIIGFFGRYGTGIGMSLHIFWLPKLIMFSILFSTNKEGHINKNIKRLSIALILWSLFVMSMYLLMIISDISR